MDGDMAFKNVLIAIVVILIGICAGALFLSDQGEART